MRDTVRRLQNKPEYVRRRFVVVATISSFAIIVLVWAGLHTLGRREPQRTGSLTARVVPPPVTPDLDLQYIANKLSKFGNPP